ncbi:hypothetical protein J27TS7_51390 [Paenibacillus dendritiformis]|nr:hypothetical protein J27TS7_51390 [Paenibacillus dendritiformis]
MLHLLWLYQLHILIPPDMEQPLVRRKAQGAIFCVIAAGAWNGGGGCHHYL